MRSKCVYSKPDPNAGLFLLQFMFLTPQLHEPIDFIGAVSQHPSWNTPSGYFCLSSASVGIL
jgi:hypothetical protein